MPEDTPIEPVQDGASTEPRQSEGFMAEQDVQTRLEQLEKGVAVAEATQAGANATQAATQAGQAATNAAGMAGMGAAVAAGAVGLVTGIFLGMAIVKASRS